MKKIEVVMIDLMPGKGPEGWKRVINRYASKLSTGDRICGYVEGIYPDGIELIATSVVTNKLHRIRIEKADILKYRIDGSKWIEQDYLSRI